MMDWDNYDKGTDLVKRVTTLWYYMGLFSGESEAETQRLKTYRTFLFVVDMFIG
jgi:hypothetical protein